MSSTDVFLGGLCCKRCVVTEGVGALSVSFAETMFSGVFISGGGLLIGGCHTIGCLGGKVMAELTEETQHSVCIAKWSASFFSQALEPPGDVIQVLVRTFGLSKRNQTENSLKIKRNEMKKCLKIEPGEFRIWGAYLCLDDLRLRWFFF